MKNLIQNGSVFLMSALIISLTLTGSCDSVSTKKMVGKRAEKEIAERIASRDFPSVFQAWGQADNLNEDPVVTLGRHDLVFLSPQALKLNWNNSYTGLANDFTDESIEEGLKFRKEVLQLNPNMAILIEIRYRDAPKTWLPVEHDWWMKDSDGNLVYGWEEGGFIRLALNNNEFQDIVAAQAGAAVKSGVADGVMLDWWDENEFPEARLAILEKVRQAVGENGLIIVNSNDREIPLSSGDVNGLFMECYGSNNPDNWEKIRTTLAWAEQNLREPHVNCLETWFDESREDLYKMRATTTLSLTHSDGYCLFSDPNSLPVPDHLHNWYPFWDSPLGSSLGEGYKRDDGAYQREYTGGTAIYNPVGNKAVTVVFKSEMKSQATGVIAKEHLINPYDGDIFLK